MSGSLLPDCTVTIFDQLQAVVAQSVPASCHRDRRVDLLERLTSRNLPPKDSTQCYKCVVGQLETVPAMGWYILIEDYMGGTNPHLLGMWDIWEEGETDPGVMGMLSSMTVYFKRST